MTDEDARESASHYRGLAEQAFAVANEMWGREARLAMLRIAAGYDRLASRLEERGSRPSPTFISNRKKD